MWSLGRRRSSRPGSLSADGDSGEPVRGADLDDFGAEVGKEHTEERARPDVAVVEDSESGEGRHGLGV